MTSVSRWLLPGLPDVPVSVASGLACAGDRTVP